MVVSNKLSDPEGPELEGPKLEPPGGPEGPAVPPPPLLSPSLLLLLLLLLLLFFSIRSCSAEYSLNNLQVALILGQLSF